MNYYKIEMIYINYPLYNYIDIIRANNEESALKIAKNKCQPINGLEYKKPGKILSKCDKWGHDL